MAQVVMQNLKTKMQATVEHFKSELKQIRTGRANPAVLDSVHFELYGSQMRIKDAAQISTPEPRQLLITPYDKQSVNAIAKGIEKANLNLQPIVDGNAVRINIPPMDENMRKEMCKICKKKCEENKVSIRGVRRDGNELLKKLKSSGDIGEDILKKEEKNIQDMTDKACKELDDLCAAKEKEVMTI